jgi:AraC-like DNA-binding protein
MDTINWASHQKNGCVHLKEVLTNIDTSTSMTSMIEGCRCAIKLKNGDLALQYLHLAKAKGYQDLIIAKILEARAYAVLKEDLKAVDILKELSDKIDLFRVMNIEEIRELSFRNPDVMKLYQASQPSFDVFTFIISVVSFLGFFIGLLFFIKGAHFIQLRWLSVFIVNFSIIMTSFVLYWTKFNFSFPFLNELWHSLYLLIGPIFYFYVRTVSGFRHQAMFVGLHLLPFFMCVLVFANAGLFYPFTKEQSTSSGLFISIFQSMPLKLFSLSLYFVMSYLSIIGDWLLDSYVKKWIQYLFIFFGLFILANIVYYGCTFWEGFNREWDYGISAWMAAGIIGVATMGFLESKYLSFQHPIGNPSQQNLHQNEKIHQMAGNAENNQATEVKKYKTSPLTSTVSNSIKLKLDRFMSEQRLYQREDLRLQDIADLLGLHRNQVSQVINENYNLNFFEWVNRYRINHAADMLAVPNCPFTISQVGFESGFNNKVTFYKTFRQYFQCTPLEYVSRLERERALMS